jgi:hypothetical protein
MHNFNVRCQVYGITKALKQCKNLRKFTPHAAMSSDAVKKR